jgi:MYXO-CTERM domain-containing protein
MAKYKLPAMLPLCFAVLVGQNAMALGLGPASLDSELGEPLFARIPIFRADGLGSEQLLVTLDTVKDGDSGIDVGSVDTRSISAVGELDRSGSGTIYLRSDRPLIEPFLHFMLTVRWPNGSLSRAYTLLFDPPVNVAADSPAGVSALKNINLNSSSTITSRSEPSRPRQVAIAEMITAESSLYTTVRGDSLWSIALRLAKVKSGSVNVWMDRLFANNPKAFIRGNRNLLKERVTLDLFESIPEPLDPDPVATQTVKPKVSKTEVVATSSVGQPGSKLAQDKVILNRREDDAENAALPGSSDEEVLSEKQFLEQSLIEVRSEADRVAENITAMTERLAALQTQLDGLNNQYRELKAVDVLTDTLPEQSDASSPVDGQVDSTAAVKPLNDVVEQAVSSTPAEATKSAIPTPVMGSPTTSGNQSDSAFISWRWLLPLAAAALGLLFWVRRRREQKDATFNVDLSDVNAAVAARATTKEAFNDVFSSLDSHTTVVARPTVKPNVDTVLDKQVGEAEVFDDIQPTTETLPDIDQRASELDEELIAALNLRPSESAANNSDEIVGDSEDADVENSIDEINFVDELFANLDDIPETVTDEVETMDFDLSAIDEGWLSDDTEDSLSDTELEGGVDDVSHRAAAALELGDYAGAKLLLETAIHENDDIELKMQLLNVLARSGEGEAFEDVALQLEFSESDDEVLREVAVLRGLLDESESSSDHGKRHAD